jgi:predicted esterase
MTLLAVAFALIGAFQDRKGEITDGTAKNGVTYHVRLPAGGDPKRPRPAILILHGSSMNSKDYVATIAAAWPKLAEDYILIGVNGENRVKDSPADHPAYNYTYVNYAGKSKYKGFPGTDRESPALVAEVLGELRQKHAIGKVFVGGHSQGGFLAYSLFMNFPDLFAGAFPISCGLIVQCEPAAYEDAQVRAQQRKGALAVVHAENDPLVDFEMGKAAYESFLDDAFPAVRFIAPKDGAHMFARLPVEDAVRWIEAMVSDDPAALLRFAEKRLGEGAFRDALAAAERAEGLDKGKKHAGKIKAIRQFADKAGRPRAKALEKAVAGAKDDAWVAEFMSFRAEFEFAPCAKPALDLYAKLRALHQKPADELWTAARRDFQGGDHAAGYAKHEEIVKKYYASSWYRYAKESLRNKP